MLLLFIFPVVNSCIPTQQVETTSTTTTTTTTTTSTTTTTPIPCPTGWAQSDERPSGPWCIKAFRDFGITQYDAQAACGAQGAVLSGIQNQVEMQMMAGLAMTGGHWLGARRTAACIGQLVTATCTRLNSFEWTDGSATGTDGFNWRLSDGEPNNLFLNVFIQYENSWFFFQYWYRQVILQNTLKLCCNILGSKNSTIGLSYYYINHFIF
ncbi:C-type lectin domain-containing protein [Caenorhabditis elegans]|uniref:C-type lectin domain-containing protein n=1 Tax=Caenorhabditis elegans TaxID=6239 RepID=Q9XXB7_CAEEL|nr:C-type lectin domain-containing protein [Caenorhabditis elegans]CAA19555.2 C-type lectin domain-containing protein [Caenorhabditis elegans]|eukprot:NP_507369.2 C-type LECtin [Caenorhabditis elegans]